MNEIQLIRAQLDAERLHARSVASACAAAGCGAADLRAAAMDYLRCFLSWFEARDRRLSELIRARPGVAQSEHRGLEAALAQPGASPEALEKLRATQGSAVGGDTGAAVNWQALAQFVGAAWSARRDAIDTLMASLTACAPGTLLTESVAARKEARC